MALSIRAQALSLLLAFAVGAGLGLLYDLLRPLRRRCGDTLWDLLFCFAAAALAFLLAMRAGSGVLGTGELALSLLGLLAYFRLPGPVLLPGIEKAAEKIETIPKRLKFPQKKTASIQKNSFKNDEDDV